jgi:energy-converting hydrogenase Eha subunit C
MRLSRFDVLSTFIVSFTLGVISFVGMIVSARYLGVALLGR